MPTYGYGYACPQCGQWISYTQSHACPGYTRPTPTFTAWWPTVDEETKNILRRIADALEKLSAK